MPMGKYKDFASCVAAKRKEGMSKESAEKYCGKIYHATHERNEKDLYGELEKLYAEIDLLYSKKKLIIEEKTKDLQLEILKKDINIREIRIALIERELMKRAGK